MNKLIITILFFSVVVGCTSQNKKLKEDLQNSKKNATEYHNLANITDEEISSLSDKELVDLAAKLYANVGGLAYYKEDSLKLLKALHFLDVALAKNPNNEAAYHNKINLHISFKEYNKAISTINSLFKLKGEYPEGLMYKGVLYETIEIKDSANLFYQKALDSYNIRIKESNNINDKVNKAILYCLLRGESAGLKEINKVIKENPDNNFAKIMKAQVIENFNREKFIKESI